MSLSSTVGSLRSMLPAVVANTSPGVILSGAFGLTSLCAFVAWMSYNLYFHPLASFPGPKLNAATPFPLYRAILKGQLPLYAEKLHAKYGEVVRIAPGEVTIINPDAWKDSTQFAQTHTRYRRSLAHGFSESSLQKQEVIVKGYMDLLIQRLHELSTPGSTVVDMTNWYNYTTFDIIGDLAFGESFGCLENSKYHFWVSVIFSHFRTAAWANIMRRLPFGRYLMKWIVPKKIQEKKAQNKMTHEKVQARISSGDNGRPDFLSNVLKQPVDKGMTEDELVSNSYVLIIAGSETTATLLSGVTYYILTVPGVMDKLKAEIRGAFATEGEITWSAVNQLPYTLAVLNEGLRMYPPVPFGFPRMVEGKGDFLCGRWDPGGSKEFIPERFMGEPEFESDKRNAVQPFSVGPRNCLGRNLAYAEMRLILARMIWNFDMEIAPDSRNWINQDAYVVWEKPALNVKLAPNYTYSGIVNRAQRMADASDNTIRLSQGSRKRGRPLLNDTQQRTLRRREQLRRAQQAYRIRKDDTISNLTNRVEELERGAQEISKSFLSLSKQLLDTKAPENYSQIASALHKATRQCLALAQAAQAVPSVSDDNEACENAADFVKCWRMDQSDDHQHIGQQEVHCDLPSKAIETPIDNSVDGPTRWVLGSSLPPDSPLGDPRTTEFNSNRYNLALPFPSPHASLPLVTQPFIHSSEETQFMQLLVQQCCLTAYELLVRQSDILRIQEVFGFIPPASNRNQMALCLYNAFQSEDTQSIQRQAKVLTFLRSGEVDFPTEPTDSLSRAWGYAFDAETGAEWLDVHGVQELLSRKGFQFQENTSALSQETSVKLDYFPSLHFDVTAFIKVLSSKAICVFPGPAFRREVVENALDFAIADYYAVHHTPRQTPLTTQPAWAHRKADPRPKRVPRRTHQGKKG
ncbi:hypothetical protein N7474_010697 [Penicillium riverlandense]|uniref:uncharacterized protein n=1 Tax=Penicillium riverlandense TaxID=1903569 RepID=UPI0025495A16|nr:uncharacterized protein N7474_010718 [Penicillium riverlandense]XP_057048378.1 uncharacterized protein N7474_010697 [Penicillium riverlandense]KAJ5804831.1 hypothetical protein N7474_010718 [Penicillium riverlandense]KAJ5807105.1 hypothetical protein N7474_010697 [Penicillium riverlandense]